MTQSGGPMALVQLVQTEELGAVIEVLVNE